jgi:hypothetical protein
LPLDVRPTCGPAPHSRQLGRGDKQLHSVSNLERFSYLDMHLDLSLGLATDQNPPVGWDWSVEHADRKLEEKADAALHGAHPFQVDRKVLRDVVREKMGVDVGRITFLSSGMCQWQRSLSDRSDRIRAGTFHKVRCGLL